MRRQSTVLWDPEDLSEGLFFDCQSDDKIDEERIPERVLERNNRNEKLAKQLEKYKDILIFPDKQIVSTEVIQPFIIGQPSGKNPFKNLTKQTIKE